MADGLLGQVPLDLQPELQGINRQQQMAQMLMQQALQQPQGQMISGRYVAPAFTQQLAPLFAAYAGSKGLETAENKQLELAKAIRQGKAQTEQKIIESLNPQNPNYAQALNLIRTNEFGAGKEFLPQVIKEYVPETPTSVREFNYAMKNPEYAGFEFAKKRAGATNVINQMGKSIAGEVGPMMKEAQGIAQAAVKTEDSANRITQAIDSNKLFTGTGANVRLGAAQLANTLGLGGDTLEAKIGNTRQAMQGLAELTLQGRQQMRGQGAITESESKLAERAISGDITFTPREIKQLADAAKRASQYTYSTYETKLGEMAKNPDTAGLVPYYQVPKMTPMNAMPDQSAIAAEKARRGIK